jgi:DNA invertase Pin-like site-specific DNA recombinase
MRVFAYARTSTDFQKEGLNDQIQRFKDLGVQESRIFFEHASGKSTDGRDQLETLLIKVESGDKVVVTKIDRLARNTLDLLNIMKKFKELNVAVEFLDERIDTSSAVGELTLTILGAIATMERGRILERTNEGRMRAKQKGVKFGRKSVLNKEDVLKLRAEGLSVINIAKQFNVTRDSVYKVLKS